MAKNENYIAKGKQKYITLKTQTFNIDNGSGTTVDDAVLYCVNDFVVVDAHCIYTEATDTSGAATANVKIGTAAGGAQIVASTNLSVSKAVGAAVKLTLVAGGEVVPAGSTIFVRHTGRAATEAGQYYVMVRGFWKA